MTITDDELNSCVEVVNRRAQVILDRHDLPPRNDPERFKSVLVGEVAEQMVIKWLRSKGKTAESAVDKTSSVPDLGYDIRLCCNDDKEVRCSVKSSIPIRLDVQGVLNKFNFATTPEEAQDVNIQVCFWLDSHSTGRTIRGVPGIKRAAIVAWAKPDDIPGYSPYRTAKRQAAELLLRDGRPMSELMGYLR